MDELSPTLGANTSAPPHERKRSKLSIDDALGEVEAAALALEESYRLTDVQETAIQKYFRLIKTSSTNVQESVLRQKNSRAMTIFHMLHDIRFLLGLKPFLLCALALTPTRMQTMDKSDAAKFPSKLQSWWEASKRPSAKLQALASQFKPIDDGIPLLTPDINLSDPPGKHCLE